MCRFPYEATLLKLAFVLSFCFSGLAFSQQRVYTVAGGYVGDGGPATAAALASPSYAAVGAGGNIYLSDTLACKVRKISLSGVISTIAGTGICGFSGDGGLATLAQIDTPRGLAVDSQGNIFFSDSSNYRIRVITPNGRISTIAGNGSYGFCGDGGPASQACLAYPSALAVSGSQSSEVLFIADTYNNRIRKVTRKTGIITTVAGDGTRGYSGDGGPATEASLDSPYGVTFYPQTHTLWISDSNNAAIRRVDTETGIITTFLGVGLFPQGISADKAGNLYVNYSGSEIVQIQVPSGNVVVVAGSDAGTNGYGGDGGPASSALVNFPSDVILDSSGNILIVDDRNNRVRKVDQSGIITTLAGGYVGDGTKGVSASLDSPAGIALDRFGNLFVADSWNNRIRRVDKSDTISTVAGTGITGYFGDGGPATSAELNDPVAVALDVSGNLYISDNGNFVIRKVDRNGMMSTFANDIYSFGLTLDGSGNLYASDQCSVWRFTPDGHGTIIAGVQDHCGYNSDGIPATQAYLYLPRGLALDAAGNLYIADYVNSRVRVVNSQGIINTVAGTGACDFTGDGGPAQDATLCFPEGVALDSKGSLYIADSNNSRIRVVNQMQVIETFAGDGSYGYNGNGTPALETGMYPISLLSTGTGFVGFSDSASNRVRIIR